MTLLTPDDYQGFPRVAPDHRYNYGALPQQFGELYLPHSEPPHPVIVLIHGGGYREMYDLRPLGAVAKSLAEAGFAVWSIEYRRHGNGGDYPHMFLDVAAAADYLRQIADIHALDLENVISAGHSAGGHLALWLAGRRQIEGVSPLFAGSPLSIHAVLALAPLADIRRAAQKGGRNEALLTVMGGHPETVPENFRNASPAELLPLGVPQTLIIGEEDVAILDNARSYAEAASRRGDKIDMKTLPNAGHFEVVSVQAPEWESARRAALDLRDLVAKSQ